jgi:ABC-2 type transport system ATP-binding protein
MTWGLEGATVRFGSRLAVEEVSVPAGPGAIVMLIGGDGAGKSSALRALVGLVDLLEGSVRRPPKERIGYLPATAGLYLDLTVDENLQFAASCYRIAPRDLGVRADRLLDQLALGEARRRLAGHLSGGMRRKLALGITLLHEPELLVLDEPTTGVDPISRVDLWRMIAGAAAEGAGVVATTTYVNEAARASYVVLLEGGRTIASGPPLEVLRSIPGIVGTAGDDTRSQYAWRRGPTWRVWSPSGELPGGAMPVTPDFDDAVVVAALADERAGGR